MAGGNERSMKALKEVWKRAENSLCADCGKPGESPNDAGGRGGRRELGLISTSHLMLAIWTAKEPGVERKGRHCSGYSPSLPGGGLARVEGEDAAIALVGTTGMWECQISRGCIAAAPWVVAMSDLKCRSRSCPVRTQQESSQ